MYYTHSLVLSFLEAQLNISFYIRCKVMQSIIVVDYHMAIIIIVFFSEKSFVVCIICFSNKSGKRFATKILYVYGLVEGNVVEISCRRF